ncbi:MAG: urease accessory protein UreF [Flavobacteriaceae bacterium]|jgi:urease accessory protein|nr:urease accessory protein UreF [Flavobacteriaceae bacterium]
MGAQIPMNTERVLMPTHIDPQFLKIQQWMSPSFPIGSFAYSHGLEWAIETKHISNANNLMDWLTDLLETGSARTDAILVSLAYRTTDIYELNQIAISLCPSSERVSETTLQGDAFCKVLNDVWGEDLSDLALPIAIGQAAKLHQIDQLLMVSSYLHAFCSNLISAAVRLVPLGQTSGQKVLSALTPLISTISKEVLSYQKHDLWSNCFLSDVASMRHETQTPRIFKT